MLFPVDNDRIIKSQQIVVFHASVILIIIFVVHQVGSEVYKAIDRLISLLVLMFFLELTYTHLLLDTFALFRQFLIDNRWYV